MESPLFADLSVRVERLRKWYATIENAMKRLGLRRLGLVSAVIALLVVVVCLRILRSPERPKHAGPAIPAADASHQLVTEGADGVELAGVDAGGPRSAVASADGTVRRVRFQGCSDGAPIERVELVEILGLSNPSGVVHSFADAATGIVEFASVEAATANHPLGVVERRILLARATGYAPRLVDEQSLAGRVNTVCLKRGAALVVTLEDADGGPVSGCRVRVQVPTAMLSDPPLDVSGMNVNRVSARRVEISSSHTDPITGRRTPHGIRGVQEWVGTTDDAGKTTLRDLAVGVPLKAEVFKGRSLLLSVDKGVTLPDGGLEQVTWRLPGTGSVRIQVVDQFSLPVAKSLLKVVSRRTSKSQPAQGAPQFVDPAVPSVARAMTDAAGVARFDDLPEGAYLVALDSSSAQSCDSNAACSPGLPIDVRRAPEDQAVVLSAHRGLHVRGRVHDSAGLPLGGAALVVVTQSGRGRWLATSAPDGQFCVGPLVPGPHRIQCVHAGGSLSAEFVADIAAAEDLVLVLDRDAGRSLELLPGEIDSNERFVAGWLGTQDSLVPARVVGNDGRRLELSPPPSDAWTVFARTSEGRVALVPGLAFREARSLSVQSESPGEFVLLRDAATDHVSVVFSSNDIAFLQVELPPGTVELKVLVPPADLNITAFEYGQRLAHAKLPVESGRSIRLLVPELVVQH